MENELTINRAGFVAIIGAPNAGKSTLVNLLVGAKVAITTHKIQTTRFLVRGIAHHRDAQLVLLDTPGIFQAKRRLDRAMIQAAWAGASEADVIVHLVDASAWVSQQKGSASPAQLKSIEDDRRVIENLKTLNKKSHLVLNKIDLFSHDEVLPIIAGLVEEGQYDEVFPISAANGDGIAPLLERLASDIPEGVALYPPDQTADLPLRLLASEITREKLMLRLHQELPYELTVETENWEERRDGSAKIQQVITVARKSHKGIVLGKGGSLIKQIGATARAELEEMLERTIHLFLFVKVDEHWHEKRERYEGLGLEFDS